MSPMAARILELVTTKRNVSFAELQRMEGFWRPGVSRIAAKSGVDQRLNLAPVRCSTFAIPSARRRSLQFSTFRL
jgi:hypothetical protein